jgi:hypothetical protein
VGIEASIKTALASIAGGRVYPDTTDGVPTPLVYPLVIYQQVGGDVINPLECTDPNLDNARIQVWVWSKTRLEASSVMRQVRVALTGSLKAFALGAPVSDYVEELKNYGSRMDFSIWYAP